MNCRFRLTKRGNVSFVVRRSSAAQEQYTDDKVTIPLDAQPLPQDWEQQVLTEWMAVTAVTQGENYAPADRNESFTLRLEKAEITGTVTVSFIRETYVSPQIQSAAETRTGELNAGAVTGWDGEKSQGWNLTCLSEDGRSRWIISMMEDGSLLMRSTGSKKDGTVWYVFRRTTAWDDIGYTAIPPQAVGHLPRRRRVRKGYPLDDLPAGRQLLHERGMGRVERHSDRHRRWNTGPHRGRHRTALHADRHGRQGVRVLGHFAER